jgi:hypothetical protein
MSQRPIKGYTRPFPLRQPRRVYQLIHLPDARRAGGGLRPSRARPPACDRGEGRRKPGGSGRPSAHRPAGRPHAGGDRKGRTAAGGDRDARARSGRFGPARMGRPGLATVRADAGIRPFGRRGRSLRSAIIERVCKPLGHHTYDKARACERRRHGPFCFQRQLQRDKPVGPQAPARRRIHYPTRTRSFCCSPCAPPYGPPAP